MSIALAGIGLLSKTFLNTACRNVQVQGLETLRAALESGKGVLTGEREQPFFLFSI
jgi:hypothetical protein